MICMYCYHWCRTSPKVSFRDSIRYAWRCKRHQVVTSKGVVQHHPDAINATLSSEQLAQMGVEDDG